MYSIDFPVDDATVSVDEKTGKSLFIDREIVMSVPSSVYTHTTTVPTSIWSHYVCAVCALSLFSVTPCTIAVLRYEVVLRALLSPNVSC